MALFNEILTGRFNRALQKYLGMKGGPPSPQLSPDIQIGIGLPLGEEFRFLEQWYLFSVAQTVAAAAANFVQMRLRNPAGSNVVAVFTKVAIIAVSAGSRDLAIGAATTDLTTVNNTLIATRDNRQGIQGGGSALVFSTAQNAAPARPGGGLANSFLGAYGANTVNDIMVKDTDEIVLVPGNALQITDLTPNITSGMCCWWRERALEEGELK